MEIFEAISTAHLIIWCVTLAVCLFFTISTCKGAIEEFIIFLFYFFGLWVIGGVLAIIAYFAGNHIEAGLDRGWNWAFSALLIVAICSFVVLVRAVKDVHDNVYYTFAAYLSASLLGMWAGISLLLAAAFGAATLDMFEDEYIVAIAEMIYVRLFGTAPQDAEEGTIIIAVLFLVACVIAAILYSAYLDIKEWLNEKRKIAQAIKAQRLAEEQLRTAEEQRLKEQKQREKENWERQKAAEIDNLFR